MGGSRQNKSSALTELKIMIQNKLICRNLFLQTFNTSDMD